MRSRVPPLWPLAHKDPRDAPKGQQSMLSKCCHRRTSRSEPPLSVYLTPRGSQEEHDDGHTTWCHGPHPWEGVSGAKASTGRTAHAGVVNTEVTLQTPRTTENQCLEARICSALGAWHRGPAGKRGRGSAKLASTVLGTRKQRELLPV